MPLVGAAVSSVQHCIQPIRRLSLRSSVFDRGSMQRQSVSKVREQTLRDAVVRGFFHWLPLSLILAFCFTPSVSATIFRAWYCMSFSYNELEEHSFLAEDLSVRCDGFAEHEEILAVAWPMVAVTKHMLEPAHIDSCSCPSEH